MTSSRTEPPSIINVFQAHAAFGPRPRQDLRWPSPTTIQPLLHPTWTGAFATRSKATDREMLPLPVSAWALGPPPSRARTPPPRLPSLLSSSPRPLPSCAALPWSAGGSFHSTPIRSPDPAPPARWLLRLPVRNPILLLLAARTDSLLPLAA